MANDSYTKHSRSQGSPFSTYAHPSPRRPRQHRGNPENGTRKRRPGGPLGLPSGRAPCHDGACAAREIAALARELTKQRARENYFFFAFFAVFFAFFAAFFAFLAAMVFLPFLWALAVVAFGPGFVLVTVRFAGLAF